MRLLVATAVLLAILPLGAAAATSGAHRVPPARRSSTNPDPGDKAFLFGREFQDLARWARANSLAFTWDGRSRTVQAGNRSQRLEFTVNARDVRLNGVNLWLSVPVATNHSRVYISSLDVRTLLQPLLQPARNKPGQKVRTVCLDPGHGGKQPGNQIGDRLEKTYTLLLARKVRALLKDAGFRVVMTRDGDTYVDLPERPAIAKRQRADLFVSLHYNAVPQGSESARGAEVYCMTPPGVLSTNSRGDDNSPTQAYVGNLNNARNVLLAYQLQRALVTNLQLGDRGVRRARFAVLRTAEVPAVLVEGGFMTDREDAKWIWSDQSRGAQARAIVDGILAYKRLAER